MAKDDRLPLSPILVEDLDAVFGGNEWHGKLLSWVLFLFVARPDGAWRCLVNYPWEGAAAAGVAPDPKILEAPGAPEGAAEVTRPVQVAPWKGDEPRTALRLWLSLGTTCRSLKRFS